MKIFTAAGAIHIDRSDEPLFSSLVAEYRLNPEIPFGTIYLIPVRRDGDIVRDARTGEELARRRLGVIRDIG